MRIRRRASTRLIAMIGITVCAGCETQTVEIRNRPRFYEMAAAREGRTLPDQVTLADGTIVVYRDPLQGRTVTTGEASEGGAERFQPRVEDEAGNITLAAMLPEHVIGNFLTCLQAEEYELFWDQLVADHMKQEYAAGGKGVEAFITICTRNRAELIKTLTRMMFGWMREDVRVRNVGGGVTRCELRSAIATEYKYTRVYVVIEGFGLKLLSVQ